MGPVAGNGAGGAYEQMNDLFRNAGEEIMQNAFQFLDQNHDQPFVPDVPSIQFESEADVN